MANANGQVTASFAVHQQDPKRQAPTLIAAALKVSCEALLNTVHYSYIIYKGIRHSVGDRFEFGRDVPQVYKYRRVFTEKYTTEMLKDKQVLYSILLT